MLGWIKMWVRAYVLWREYVLQDEAPYIEYMYYLNLSTYLHQSIIQVESSIFTHHYQNIGGHKEEGSTLIGKDYHPGYNGAEQHLDTYC